MNWTIEKLVIKVEWESENYEGKYDRQKLKEDIHTLYYRFRYVVSYFVLYYLYLAFA